MAIAFVGQFLKGGVLQIVHAETQNSEVDAAFSLFFDKHQAAEFDAHAARKNQNPRLWPGSHAERAHHSHGVDAYRIAQENFIADGANRVILATDGDFNVGVTNQGDLLR